MFTGFQVAGPRLTPGTIDKGFHAIPPGPSGNPAVPACFYNSGDFTCVKDATAMWFDPSGSVGGNPGCWRMPDNGKRYLPDGWPTGNVESQRTAKDPCNGAELGSPKD